MILRNAFTVDVEDYFQVSAFENDIDRRQWGNWDTRVVQNTRRILALMDRHEVRGTFFALGWVAERHPTLIREIHARGHELGSHGYWHRLVYQQSPDEFRNDVRRSREVLEDIVGCRVNAYRAPSFSITKQSLWALPILVEEGFTIDSSIFPIHHDRYGVPDAPTGIRQIVTEAGSLWEFPPSVVKVAGVKIPVSGGGYFRLYPLSWTLRFLARFNRTTHQPFMFYVHPWEIDFEQPRLRAGSFVSRFRHYVNLSQTEGKLNRLLEAFRVGPIGEAILPFQRSATLTPAHPSA